MTDSSSDTLTRPATVAGVLTETDAVANLPVRNMALARDFYESTLGFEPVATMGDELVSYRSGGSRFNVYRSDYAGTNRATALTWAVGDRVEQVARTLAAKGITFEHYDLPGMTRDGDVHAGEGVKVAWFKDPDGNILNIVSG
ncbi:MAG TPA: VOC family protein [Allosphingosinicella sp.]|jgi:catechol 2,3-dioxygenase-like lactoylglutathione lyase family enzyme|nr:VOC family protein [Allosphingosinicella sp.]